MLRLLYKRLSKLILCTVFLLPAVPLQSQTTSPEIIPLIAIDSYAETALWVEVFLDYFIPEVDRRLEASGKYEIKWNKAFGGTIAKSRGVFDALKYDLADIGIITTPYHADKVPFHNLPYVTPFVTNDIDLVTRTMSTLVQAYPELSNAWQKHGLIYLTVAGSIDSYQVLTELPVTTLDEFVGLKINGVGMNLRYLSGVGATPVNSSMSDWYNNIATGLVNGAIGWAEGAISYRLYEVAPNMLEVNLGSVSTKVLAVNESTWMSLPEEVKLVLRETAESYRDELARETDRLATTSRKEFIEYGGSIQTLSEAQRKKWAEGLPNMAQEWADDMETRGYPGHALLKDYMDRMRANGQNILRHWDRE